jgi:hypothetical protein
MQEELLDLVEFMVDDNISWWALSRRRHLEDHGYVDRCNDIVETTFHGVLSAVMISPNFMWFARARSRHWSNADLHATNVGVGRHDLKTQVSEGDDR